MATKISALPQVVLGNLTDTTFFELVDALGASVKVPINYLRGQINIGAFIFNVMDPKFGADNTGVRNSTAAFSAAFAALSAAGGGIVYAPKGTYLLSFVNDNANAIAVGNGWLVGQGQDTVFLADPATCTSSVMGAAPASCTMFTYDSSARFSNFMLDGNRHNLVLGGFTSLQATAITPVRLTGVSGHIFEDLWIARIPAAGGMESFGIMNGQATSSYKIRRIKAWDCDGTPIHVNGEIDTNLANPLNDGTTMTSNVDVDEIETYNNTWQGISIYGAKNVRLRGVHAYSNTFHGINVEFSQEIDIFEPVCHDNGYTGIDAKGPSRVDIWGGSVCNNNTGNSTNLAEILAGAGTWPNGAPQPQGTVIRLGIHGTRVQPKGANYHLRYETNTNANCKYLDTDGVTVVTAA
ncbi:MAG: hypothetical protein KGL39_55405, partial [Patescibacteria group bacterium]|nr:hypothetical protein [Patescibacteria group bacterium]